MTDYIDLEIDGTLKRLRKEQPVFRKLEIVIDELIDAAANGNADFSSKIAIELLGLVHSPVWDEIQTPRPAFDHREGMEIRSIPCQTIAKRTRKPCRLHAEWLREDGSLRCHTHRWRKD